MTSERLQLLAARVVACDAMLQGATFAETFRLLTAVHGLGKRQAFNVVLRVFRGGGFAKDAIYLRGLLQVLGHLENGGSLTPLWMGKISAEHLAAVDELRARGTPEGSRHAAGIPIHRGSQAQVKKGYVGHQPNGNDRGMKGTLCGLRFS